MCEPFPAPLNLQVCDGSVADVVPFCALATVSVDGVLAMAVALATKSFAGPQTLRSATFEGEERSLLRTDTAR